MLTTTPELQGRAFAAAWEIVSWSAKPTILLMSFPGRTKKEECRILEDAVALENGQRLAWSRTFTRRKPAPDWRAPRAASPSEYESTFAFGL